MTVPEPGVDTPTGASIAARAERPPEAPAGDVSEADLAAVQRRREFPVRFIQRVQRLMQDRIAAPGLEAGREFRLPWFVRLLTALPVLRDLPGRVLAFGVRRVRVRTGPA